MWALWVSIVAIIICSRMLADRVTDSRCQEDNHQTCMHLSGLYMQLQEVSVLKSNHSWTITLLYLLTTISTHSSAYAKESCGMELQVRPVLEVRGADNSNEIMHTLPGQTHSAWSPAKASSQYAQNRK